jgi:hypothetical protein
VREEGRAGREAVRGGRRWGEGGPRRSCPGPHSITVSACATEDGAQRIYRPRNAAEESRGGLERRRAGECGVVTETRKGLAEDPDGSLGRHPLKVVHRRWRGLL